MTVRGWQFMGWRSGWFGVGAGIKRAGGEAFLGMIVSLLDWSWPHRPHVVSPLDMTILKAGPIQIGWRRA